MNKNSATKAAKQHTREVANLKKQINEAKTILYQGGQALKFYREKVGILIGLLQRCDGLIEAGTYLDVSIKKELAAWDQNLPKEPVASDDPFKKAEVANVT